MKIVFLICIYFLSGCWYVVVVFFCVGWWLMEGIFVGVGSLRSVFKEK